MSIRGDKRRKRKRGKLHRKRSAKDGGFFGVDMSAGNAASFVNGMVRNPVTIKQANALMEKINSHSVFTDGFTNSVNNAQISLSGLSDALRNFKMPPNDFLEPLSRQIVGDIRDNFALPELRSTRRGTPIPRINVRLDVADSHPAAVDAWVSEMSRSISRRQAEEQNNHLRQVMGSFSNSWGAGMALNLAMTRDQIRQMQSTQFPNPPRPFGRDWNSALYELNELLESKGTDKNYFKDVKDFKRHIEQRGTRISIAAPRYLHEGPSDYSDPSTHDEIFDLRPYQENILSEDYAVKKATGPRPWATFEDVIETGDFAEEGGRGIQSDISRRLVRRREQPPRLTPKNNQWLKRRLDKIVSLYKKMVEDSFERTMYHHSSHGRWSRDGMLGRLSFRPKYYQPLPMDRHHIRDIDEEDNSVLVEFSLGGLFPDLSIRELVIVGVQCPSTKKVHALTVNPDIGAAKDARLSTFMSDRQFGSTVLSVGKET